ncbi:MAG TPA: thiamine-phosphate kinase [Dehalococcoidia bacterium]|nr:thiamine-phosphate kinase [Dehalococcoidia bacterium]
MLVSEIGEFGLIKLLAKELGIEYPPKRGQTHPGLRVGLGDDAVVGRRHDGALIWTTDTMVAGVHFLPQRTAWRDTGWKALAVNLSDIAAMGGRPDLALVTLMLPPEFCVEDAVELYRGLKDASEAFSVTIGGGDIVRASEFAVTVALSGWAYSSSRLGEPQVMTRDAARTGDLVAVSGSLGDSAAGLSLLDQGAAFDTEAQKALRLAHERPQPRVELGQMAVRAGVRCGMDVSDGLVQDLGHIATASHVQVRIDAARIPLSDVLHETFPGRALGLALSGGEDYELLMTAPARVIDALIATSQTPLTVIGEVVSGDAVGVAVTDETGREIPLGRAGWDHLSKP